MVYLLIHSHLDVQTGLQNTLLVVGCNIDKKQLSDDLYKKADQLFETLLKGQHPSDQVPPYSSISNYSKIKVGDGDISCIRNDTIGSTQGGGVFDISVSPFDVYNLEDSIVFKIHDSEQVLITIQSYSIVEA